MANRRRARWAGLAVATFAHTTRMDVATEGTDTVLTDLLADLMHFAHREEVDFCACLRRAAAHYTEEAQGEEG